MFNLEKNNTIKSESFSISVAEAILELERDKEEIYQFSSRINETEATEGAREYTIDELPKPRELQRLANLPFEISITEYEGKILLSTGTPELASHRFDIDGKKIDMVNKRHNYSKVSIHTHPQEGVEQAHVPSLDDLLSLVGDTKPMYIASPEKLCVVGFAADVTEQEIEMVYKELEEMREGYESGALHKNFVQESAMDTFTKLQNTLGDRMMVREYEWDEGAIIDELKNLT